MYMEPNPTFELGPKVLLKTKNCMESFFSVNSSMPGMFHGMLFILLKKIKSRVFRVPLICKISGVPKNKNKKRRGGNFFVEGKEPL